MATGGSTDGALDVITPGIFGAVDGRRRLLADDGAGGFPSEANHVGMAGKTEWVTAADLDGDGLIEVIATSGDTPNIGVFLAQPDGPLDPFVASRAAKTKEHLSRS